jgi:hypothetical protein
MVSFSFVQPHTAPHTAHQLIYYRISVIPLFQVDMIYLPQGTRLLEVLSGSFVVASLPFLIAVVFSTIVWFLGDGAR